MAVGRPPALYSAYEREGQETKFKPYQEKKRYEELDDGRALVAACDAWDRAGRPRCSGSSGEGKGYGCYDDSKEGSDHGGEHNFVVVPERICSKDKKAFRTKD